MTNRTLPWRRLLLLPALALVLLGTPVLATEDTAPPPPTQEDVAVAPPTEPLAEGWTSAETPTDANLVGVRWNGDPDAEFTVEAKSADGTWEAAAPVGEDDTGADEGSSDATRELTVPGPDFNTEPVWIGDDVTAVRVTLDTGSAADVTVAAVDSQPAGTPEGSVGAFGLTVPVQGPQRYAFAAVLFALVLLLGAVALGWSPWRGASKRRVLALLVLSAGVTLAGCVPIAGPGPSGGLGGYADPPTVNMRGTWGADLPFQCAGGPETMDQLKFAVIHHTAGSNSYGPGDTPSILRGIYSYHVNVNGYCDVAYNFFVDKYGQLWEGRWGGVNNAIMGGHAGGFNTYSTGIAILGNYTTAQLSQPAYNSLTHLLRWKLSFHRINPAAGFVTMVLSSPCNCQRWPVGTLVSFPSAIVGHGDVDYSECPGGNVSGRFGQLRADVQAGIKFAPDPTTTTTT